MIRQIVTLLALAVIALPAEAQSTRTTTWVLTDQLGSPIMLVSGETGQMVWEAQYGPFGEVVAESGTPADRAGYTGHYRDAGTGLVYMQQRYYDPAAGRFLSVDPVTPSMHDGSNFNRYWYANNNPYKYVDPDGRHACVIMPHACIAAAVKAGKAIVAGVTASGGAIGITRSVADVSEALSHRNESADGGDGSEGDRWFGTNPREKEGRVNTDGTGNVDADWEEITGGVDVVIESGDRVGQKGERLRETADGPRIDLPAKSTGNRKHETVHYPPRRDESDER